MSKTTIELVEEFHRRAGHLPPEKVDVSSLSVNLFRIKLLNEELTELIEALNLESPLETLDALLDLQYVLDGTFIQLGFADIKQAAFEEVHRSNMSKEFPTTPINVPHKITKGKNYSPPNLEQFLK